MLDKFRTDLSGFGWLALSALALSPLVLVCLAALVAD